MDTQSRSAKIMVLGDVHGDWGPMNALLNKKQPDIVLQCGDFGYWQYETISASSRGRLSDKLKRCMPRLPEGCKLYWCDGNHENHWALKSRTTDVFWPGVTYMPRGSLMELPDGRKVMFAGGAHSVDQQWRKLGIDWFPEEVLSMADMMKFPTSQKVDIVISHTCPSEFRMESDQFDRVNDCSRDALSSVLRAYRPSRWFFGHWHRYAVGRWASLDGQDIDCRWQCVTMAGQSGWWTWLTD